MKVILSAPGSRGDVNPMVAIGRELKRRGHDVVISLAQPYQSVAAEAGLEVEPVFSQARFDELLGDPNVWKPIRGARTILGKVAMEFLPLHYDVIQRHFLPGETVLVSHPLDFASRIFREADVSVPLVDIHLAPCMLRTYGDPPRMTPWWFEVSKPPWFVRTAYAMVDRLIVDPIIAKPINRFRRSVLTTDTLKPVHRIIEDWWLSPDKILAMYPDWFAPATLQYAPRLSHCGFPCADMPQATERLPSDAPVAFTAGTAHRHARKFFTQAVDACLRIGCPGLLLTTHPECLPDSLPSQVRAMGYTSFSDLFPRCVAVVHHGGVGTTSQCLAAGVPQLIRPLAFDQFDHANRMESLGVGRWLRGPFGRSRDTRMTEVLRDILQDEAMKRRANEIAQTMQGNNAIETAVDKIVQATVTIG